MIYFMTKIQRVEMKKYIDANLIKESPAMTW